MEKWQRTIAAHQALRRAILSAQMRWGVDVDAPDSVHANGKSSRIPGHGLLRHDVGCAPRFLSRRTQDGPTARFSCAASRSYGRAMAHCCRLVVLLGSATLAVGCGDRGPEDAALDFVKATSKGDGQKACDLFTPQPREDFNDLGGIRACVEAYSDQDQRLVLDSPQVRASRINGDAASVVLRGKGGKEITVKVRKVEGDWRVAD